MTGRSAARAPSVARLTAMRQLMALTCLGFTSFFATLSSLPTWAVLGGAGVGRAGLVTTAMLVCTVAAQLLVPVTLERLGTAVVLGVGLVALGAPAPLYLLGQELWWLMAVSALRGVGFAVLTVLGATLVARIAPPRQRGEAIGLYGLAVAVPNLVAVPGGVALALAGHFGWVVLVATAPLLALPLVVPLSRRTGAVARDAGAARTPGREVLAVAVPSVMLLVVTLAGGGLLTFLPIERPEGRLAVVSLGVFGLAAAGSRWAAGVVADRTGTRLLLPLSLLGIVVGIAGVGLGLLTAGAAGDAFVLVAALVLGLGYGSMQNLTLLVAFARAERPEVASATWNVCFDLGTALGAFAVGWVAAAGLGIPGAYVGCALLVALTLPLAWSGRQPGGRARKQSA